MSITASVKMIMGFCLGQVFFCLLQIYRLDERKGPRATVPRGNSRRACINDYVSEHTLPSWCHYRDDLPHIHGT